MSDQHVESVRVFDDDVEYSIDELLAVDLDNLDPAFTRMSADLVWWDTLLADKHHEIGQLNIALDKLEAGTEIRIRNILATDPTSLGLEKGIKPTEALVKAFLAQDNQLLEFKQTLLEHKRDLAALKAIVNGLEKRSVLLVTVGGKKRAEAQLLLRSHMSKVETST